MKTKLSAAQKKILDKAIEEIIEARSCSTFEEYFNKFKAPHYNCGYNTPEKYISRDPEGWEKQKQFWEGLKQGITLTSCNTKTIKKLESLGYIEIIEDANRVRWGIDTIKVLNI